MSTGAPIRSGSVITRRDQPGQQLASSAGGAIITAARMGRLLGRSGWRLARQLPGMSLVEEQASRLRHAASAELLRLLEVPQQLFGTASPEEQRVMMLVRDADADPAPLRTAMSELLSRSGQTTASRSKEYLFGTIVSQLVPDEARVLAALAEGKRYAVVDVVARHVGRSATRTVFANASLLGAAAGVSPARNVATYLTRLQQFGLVEFGPAADELSEEYDKLAVDGAVQEARALIERNRMGSAKLIRKSVALSALGSEFWAACAPSR
jgi:DNA-binding transcriptional ArsR family regulator